MAKKDITLEDLRDMIDALDKSIHEKLNERAKLAQQVAEVKLRDVPEELQDQVV